jgi:hypothetical protein
MERARQDAAGGKTVQVKIVTDMAAKRAGLTPQRVAFLICRGRALVLCKAPA